MLRENIIAPPSERCKQSIVVSAAKNLLEEDPIRSVGRPADRPASKQAAAADTMRRVRRAANELARADEGVSSVLLSQF